MKENQISKEEKDVKQQPQPRSKPTNVSDKKNDTVIYLSIGLLLAMFVPYLYYAAWVYDYGHKHQPEGFNFPQVSAFWRMLVGAVVSQSTKRLV